MSSIDQVAEANGYFRQMTGGNCTAWEKPGKRAYVWLTIADEAEACSDPSEPVTVGIYWRDQDGCASDMWACATFPDFARGMKYGDLVLNLVDDLDGTPTNAALLLRHGHDSSGFSCEGIPGI